jgi:hypothetical protein
MKAADATDLIRKLLADETEAVQAQPAIAMYRLTGEKAKQFPVGYNAEWGGNASCLRAACREERRTDPRL